LRLKDDRALRAALAQSEHPSPVVREHVAWARAI
jgi:hypothetical protein